MPTPLITGLQVIPVAGRDSMLLNLSGAHGPFFTRNIVILSDSAGHSGVGEVPGGEKIRQTLEDARDLLIGRPIGEYLRILQLATAKFADRDVGPTDDGGRHRGGDLEAVAEWPHEHRSPRHAE